MAEPIEVTLTIDLNKHLADHVGYDEDGEPITHHTTVEDVVLGLVADKLIKQLTHGTYDWRQELARRVRDIRDEQIAQALRPDVEAALTAPIQKTTAYGDPVGEPTTLRDLIVAKVEDWLKSSDRDSYRNPKGLTKPQQIIAEEVDRALSKEMKAAVDAAKAEVIAAVQAKGAGLIAQTIAEMARTR